jgi:hypothetical protein
VFDSEGNRFATMGIRMGAQGHYEEAVPPPPVAPAHAMYARVKRF